jgi:ABC-type bacteriocin/lantibiotic exporter with double-glycine peptidase domain
LWYQVLFLVLNIAVAVLTSVRTVLFAVLGQRTAKHMHTALTHSVLAAPLAWCVFGKAYPAISGAYYH